MFSMVTLSGFNRLSPVWFDVHAAEVTTLKVETKTSKTLGYPTASQLWILSANWRQEKTQRKTKTNDSSRQGVLFWIHRVMDLLRPGRLKLAESRGGRKIIHRSISLLLSQFLCEASERDTPGNHL